MFIVCYFPFKNIQCHTVIQCYIACILSNQLCWQGCLRYLLVLCSFIHWSVVPYQTFRELLHPHHDYYWLSEGSSQPTAMCFAMKPGAICTRTIYLLICLIFIAKRHHVQKFKVDICNGSISGHFNLY